MRRLVPWMNFAEKDRQQTFTSGAKQYPRLRVGQSKQAREYAGHAGQISNNQKARARSLERVNEWNRGITNCLGVVVKRDFRGIGEKYIHHADRKGPDNEG